VAEPRPVETVPIDSLREHPENYRDHPPDQVQHLEASLEEHGFYRNIVVARDGTILAGHGIVVAARNKGYQEVPVVRLDCDPHSPQALRVLTGDNELTRLAESDDRQLTELLRQIAESDAGLLGTGYDDMMLANLLTVTRPHHEIRGMDEAAEWLGMPDYESEENPLKLRLNFRSEEDRQKFVDDYDIKIVKHFEQGRMWSAWWPEWEEQRNDYVRSEWTEEAS
jgi:hypothetical protein